MNVGFRVTNLPMLVFAQELIELHEEPRTFLCWFKLKILGAFEKISTLRLPFADYISARKEKKDY